MEETRKPSDWIRIHGRGDDGVEFEKRQRGPPRSAFIIPTLVFAAATEHSPSRPSPAAAEAVAGASSSDPPRIAAGLDDYAEIFGDLPGSSDIPYFDLPPALDGFGAAGSGLDYSEVFGGGADESAASSYEELFAAPMRKEICSWNPRKTDAANCGHRTVEELKLSPAYSRGSHIGSEEEGDRLSLNSNSSDNVFTQFSVSHSKARQAFKEVGISPAETHIPQLHAVPAPSFVAVTDTPLQTTESDDPSSMLSDGTGNGRHENKSQASSSSSSRSSEKYQRAYPDHITTYPSRKHNVYSSHNSRSSSGSMFSVDVSSSDINHMAANISLHTQPVTVPPPVRPPPRLSSDNQVHPKPRISSSANPEDVDFSSAAAASVAAVEEAMQFAQAKLKIAKELEKKHGNLLKCKKLAYQNGIKEKEGKVSQTSPEQE